MEEIVSLLTTLNGLSPLAVIALLGVVIFQLVRNKQQVAIIQDNHLHSLPDMVDTLQRIEVTLSALDSYLRARLNGRPPNA